jgi:LacI family transcriptional regulator
MKDVARLAEVSTATVSAVITGRGYVSPPLKARVRQAVRQLNYAPSVVARSLRTRTTRLIGLIVADITNPFFTQLVRSIRAAVQAGGYSVLLCETDHDPEQELAALQLLAAHGVDGVILAPTGPAEMYFHAPVTTFPKPIVTVDRVVADAPFDSVTIDNYGAAFEVTQYMLSLGHRRLAIVAGAPHLTNTVQRLAGFGDALAAAKLKLDSADIVYADFREDRSYALCRDLLSQADRPTALFVSNNQMAIGAMHAMMDLGLKCPDDISLAAIDDFPWAGAFSPRLTVQKQPIEDIAGTAARLLLKRMTAGNGAPPERVVLRTSLIIRESCKHYTVPESQSSSRAKASRPVARRRTPERLVGPGT